ncbi:hypothetical protein DENIS_1572 [Desulfonema ishimotonii]|uniref:histidine kinase n=1 Tax=Desulfonema ishimotonii TaxID=45657 RepID=A0A401FUI4_9BACT|nr:cache domain-containing protein [Desulfonema ishimotonii]GBC60615.1 hypothetical protein DENIS_1572 [Desulfonema ishimotonii]
MKIINEDNITKFYFAAMVGVIALLSASLAYFFASRQHREFQDESWKMASEFSKIQRMKLIEETEQAVDAAAWHMRRTERILKKNIREETYKACTIARTLYNRNKGRMTDDEIRIQIREALRDVRFNQGRGYFFINDMERKKWVLLPTAPHLEGTDFRDHRDNTGDYIMRDFIRIVKTRNEGFSAYRWYRPGNAEVKKRKISFVKYFEPLNWIIGTGEYLEDVTRDIQQTLLARLSQIRFGQNGYISVLRHDGTVLLLPSRPGLTRMNARKADIEHARDIAQTLIEISRRGGGFYRYKWFRPNQDIPVDKLAYADSFEEWEWTIIASVYLDPVKTILSQKRIELEESVRENIVVTIWIFIAATLGAILISFFLSREIHRIFNTYKTDIRKRNRGLQRVNDELKHRIEELCQSERARILLLSAIEQASESVIITDPAGRIEYVNSAFEQITGYSRAEAEGKTTGGQHDERLFQTIRDALNRRGTWQGQVTNRRKDGGLYHAYAAVSPVTDHAGEIINYISIQRDITHEVALEAELRQAHKMEAIGTLAGGIAHDFNNILFPIMGYTEMTLEDVPPDSLAHRNLKEVFTGVQRAKELVQQILAFSRMEETRKQPIRLQTIIREALKLLRASLPSTIEIVRQISPECRPVMGDSIQIHQVIINLCTNAFQAMKDTGGRLYISLSEKQACAGDGISPAPGSASYLELVIRDTGHGIEKAILERIFDPYFTTKGPGEGTGMGLAVVHGIISDHAGDISVTSAAGKGTVFTVRLPVSEEETASEASCGPVPPANGAEHILVVDDEKSVTLMLKQMLEHLGYRVSACNQPDMALRQFQAAPGGFDLVISDMTMPKMTGDRLIREMRSHREDVPVILCTGFSETFTPESARSVGAQALLMKPIDRNELAAAIRAALDGSG